ncbi:ATP-binding protein [Streptomyces sp. NPDC050564]|uniref:ATP-binding protein n=1 Tax=Streptomyces sp. NPDC050564 TaxID=3365631 RepID=UPI00379DD22E
MTRTSAAQPRSTGHPGYTLTQNRVLEAAEEARRLTRVALAAWGLDDDAETAALIMSELVANAARHARGPKIRVTVNRPADNRIYLAVVDRAPHQLPQMRATDHDAVQGRGLFLVDAVADRWGYDFMGAGSQPWGKRVWAELTVTP